VDTRSSAIQIELIFPYNFAPPFEFVNKLSVGHSNVLNFCDFSFRISYCFIFHFCFLLLFLIILRSYLFGLDFFNLIIFLLWSYICLLLFLVLILTLFLILHILDVEVMLALFITTVWHLFLDFVLGTEKLGGLIFLSVEVEVGISQV